MANTGWFTVCLQLCEPSMSRVQLCVLAVVAVCVSGREFPVKETSTGKCTYACSFSHWDQLDSVANLDYDWSYPDGLASKNTYPPGCNSKTEVGCISNWEDVFCILQKNAMEKSRLDRLGSHWSAILLLIHNIGRNTYDYIPKPMSATDCTSPICYSWCWLLLQQMHNYNVFAIWRNENKLYFHFFSFLMYA